MDVGRETVILGGGLAGLGAAYYSGWQVYESRDRIGGTADSYVKDDFVFDIGIHILQSKLEAFHVLTRELGVGFVERRRNAWIYSCGSYAAYPFQVNTSHLPLPLRLRCVLGYLLRNGNAAAENYEEWMVANFGKGFARQFLIPYAEKFWRVSPRQMTYEWTDARVPRPRLSEVLRGAFRNLDTGLGTNALFQYPSQQGAGFAGLPAGFLGRIPAVKLNMTATGIDPEAKRIVFNGGETSVCYDHVISTLPLPELLKLLPGVPEPVSCAAARLAFNSIAAVNLGIARSDLSDKHWIHYPEQDIAFFRISFPKNFCNGLVPDGTASIQAEVTYDVGAPPDRRDLIDRVRNDLVKVGVLRADDRIVFSDVIYQDYGYVIYDQHRKESVAAIHQFLNSVGIHACGRYGSWEYLWSDEAILSGKRAAEQVLALKTAGPGPS